jgi:hypothetical protein
MNKFWNLAVVMWKPVLLCCVGIFGLFFLLIWQLTTLLPGLSSSEMATLTQTRSLTSILEAGVNAPYNTAVFFSRSLSDSIFTIRAVSAAVGIISGVLFFVIVSRIVTTSVAYATTLLFVTSSLFLAVSRQATALVMLFSLLSIIAVGYYLRFVRPNILTAPLVCLVIGLGLYVPGMVLFIVPMVLWQYKYFRRLFEAQSPIFIIATSLLFGLLLSPLIVSLVRDPGLWQDYLGFSSLTVSLLDVGRNILQAVGSIFIISPKLPEIWLGKQPILDVFTAALFIYGLVSLFRHLRLDRTLIFLFVIIFSFLWIGFTGYLPYIVVILPFLYLVCAVGLQSLLRKWLLVFPRNPIARGVGYALIGIGVVLAANFQLQRYFVAWPNTSHTKAVYNNQYIAK